MTEIFNQKPHLDRRRFLRNRLTQAENKLWYFLRGKNLGVKFRRQFGIGPYTVDFYSPEIKLVVEVDGDSHGTEEARQNDDIRQQQIESLGLKVIRFTNLEVLGNMNGVLEAIQNEINRRRYRQLSLCITSDGMAWK